jgi:hypothetical protein
VLPAKASLGSRGCTDCHSGKSPFFYGAVLDQPFTSGSGPKWVPNYAVLSLSAASVRVGAVREEWVKPALYSLLAILAVLLIAMGVRRTLADHATLSVTQLRRITAGSAICGLAIPAIGLLSPGLLSYMTFNRFALDANHFWIAILTLISGLWIAISSSGPLKALRKVQYALALIAAVTGAMMLLVRWPSLAAVSRYAYTTFDLALVGAAAVSVWLVAVRLVAACRQS